MKLRNYQEECIEILSQNRKKQLIQLPTGSGKTFIFLNYLCLQLKKEELESKNVHKKTIEDFVVCSKEFSDLMNIPIGDITSDMIRKISNEMMNSVVRRGGNSTNNTGNFRKSSPSTVLRKLRILACVFSYMIEKGANITNVA